MTDANRETAPRPLNSLAALTLVLVFPAKTFERLTERPHWILPLVFVVCAVMVNRLVALSGGLMDDLLRSEAFLSGADLAEAKSAALVFGVVLSIVAIPVVTILQTFFLKIVGGLLGGRSRFRVVFSAIAHASVPVGVSALALAALMPVSRSATVGANLAFLVEPTAHPFLWSLLMELDLAAVWFFVLVGIAAEPVFRLPRRRARVATLLFAVLYVLVMSWTGRESAGRIVDPFDGWATHETPGAVLHFREEMSEDVRASAAGACELAGERIGRVTGIVPRERIDCFLYPSLDEKRRVTGNPAAAHRVEWAGAIHVAWVDGVEAPFIREMLKLTGAQALGKVYNPLIRDGLAVYAGGEWAGVSVREAGRDLLARKALPRLERLADRVAFDRTDERLTQPAAGSFVAFLIDEVGAAAIRDIYRASTVRPAAVVEILERSLGDSLRGIERRWTSFLEAEVSAPEIQAATPEAELRVNQQEAPEWTPDS